MTTLIIVCAKYLIALPVAAYLVFWWLLPAALRMRALIVLAVSAVASYLVALLAGALYYDPRPFVVGNFTPLVAHAADNGFPSDHTLLASVIAFAVFSYNKWLGIALFIVALLVGFARVFAGIHHTVDILGSVVIAGVIAGVVYMLSPQRAQ